jgi:hypothetical protein
MWRLNRTSLRVSSPSLSPTCPKHGTSRVHSNRHSPNRSRPNSRCATPCASSYAAACLLSLTRASRLMFARLWRRLTSDRQPVGRLHTTSVHHSAVHGPWHPHAVCRVRRTHQTLPVAPKLVQLSTPACRRQPPDPQARASLSSSREGPRHEHSSGERKWSTHKTKQASY